MHGCDTYCRNHPDNLHPAPDYNGIFSFEADQGHRDAYSMGINCDSPFLHGGPAMYLIIPVDFRGRNVPARPDRRIGCPCYIGTPAGRGCMDCAPLSLYYTLGRGAAGERGEIQGGVERCP